MLTPQRCRSSPPTIPSPKIMCSNRSTRMPSTLIPPGRVKARWWELNTRPAVVLTVFTQSHTIPPEQVLRALKRLLVASAYMVPRQPAMGSTRHPASQPPTSKEPLRTAKGWDRETVSTQSAAIAKILMEDKAEFLEVGVGMSATTAVTVSLLLPATRRIIPTRGLFSAV